MTKQVVTRANFPDIVKELLKPGVYDVDAETTGLKWYDEDELFALTIGDGKNHYYFDFNWHEDHLGNKTPEDTRLYRDWIRDLLPIFKNPDSYWFAHNAKFDLAMLARDGLCVAGKVHCTEAVARLIDPTYKSYRLVECVSRMNKALKLENGEEKSDAVMDYITKHKLYTDVEVRGKDKTIREVYFHKVPFQIMVDYTLTDGVVTNSLGHYQLERLKKIYATNPQFKNVVENEMRLTKTALSMAQAGFGYDAEHVEKALDAEVLNMERVKKEYKGFTGEDFVDSGVAFAKVFDAQGFEYYRTEAGNPSFDEYNISRMKDSPLLDLILAHRGSAKLAGTYYSSFSYYGAAGRIHADMRQGGTITGRVSYREPNMQNIPKPDEDEADNTKALQVRGCFKPDPDFCLFMPDYDQMEYRMMLDQAEEMSVIKLILDHGLDVHQATAQMMGVTRKQAKTINFMLLYGGGIQKLADELGISYLDAKTLKAQYFMKLPRVRVWNYRTIKRAEIKGFSVNWFGRSVKIDKGYSYKAPNYEIQGGTAEVVKIVMNKCEDDMRAKKMKSRLLLQVHDELIFNMHKSELDYCPTIVKTMESTYPHKHLPLTVGPAHSWKSWGDKIKGYPHAHKN